MKNLKTFNEFVNENSKFKSDKEIESEFDNFKLNNIKFEIRDLSNSKTENTYEGSVEWGFPEAGEHVGGGSSDVVEYFKYNTNTNTFTYVLENWTPDEIVDKMISIIQKELKKKYKNNFKYLKNIDFIKMHDK
jgi:hypothetical protein